MLDLMANQIFFNEVIHALFLTTKCAKQVIHYFY